MGYIDPCARRRSSEMTTHSHAAPDTGPSLNQLALSATVHCLTGSAIGEVLGMVIGTALGWSNAATIVASILLAFVFGYGLTSLPLLRAGLGPRPAAPLAFASRLRLRHALDHDDGDRRHADHRADPGRQGRGTRRPAVLGQPRGRVAHR